MLLQLKGPMFVECFLRYTKLKQIKFLKIFSGGKMGLCTQLSCRFKTERVASKLTYHVYKSCNTGYCSMCLKKDFLSLNNNYFRKNKTCNHSTPAQYIKQDKEVSLSIFCSEIFILTPF